MECTSKSDTGNNRGNKKNIKIIQKVREQYTGKTRNQRTTENSHIWYYTQVSESTNVKVQYIQNYK